MLPINAFGRSCMNTVYDHLFDSQCYRKLDSYSLRNSGKGRTLVSEYQQCSFRFEVSR
jgi:hypothetical protein